MFVQCYTSKTLFGETSSFNSIVEIDKNKNRAKRERNRTRGLPNQFGIYLTRGLLIGDVNLPRCPPRPHAFSAQRFLNRGWEKNVEASACLDTAK